jgi:hypothetical protein
MSSIGKDLRKVQVTRYVTPLREGGSMPALAEADDGFLYVLKFRGAGQGPKVLIAELLGGEIARMLGLKVPELVFADLNEAFGRTEPDEEIQDLLKASTGLNLALHFLSGAFGFDPVANKVDALLASKIVWLDGFLMNMDRTVRNTNMLIWNHELWLIDHGAALYFHHSGQPWDDKFNNAFELIKKHVLYYSATKLNEADAWAKHHITPEKIDQLVSIIPDEWIEADLIYETVNLQKQAYANFLKNRLLNASQFIKSVPHGCK